MTFKTGLPELHKKYIIVHIYVRIQLFPYIAGLELMCGCECECVSIDASLNKIETYFVRILNTKRGMTKILLMLQIFDRFRI